MTLLEQARAAQRTGQRYTPEHVELALAWIREEVGFACVGAAIKKKGAGVVYNFLALALREAYRNGQLTIAKPSKK